MKKTVAVAIILFVAVIIVIAIGFKNIEKDRKEITIFNLTYEDYNKSNLNGLDITTVINKAINNNEKYNIQKDEYGNYIPDDMHSIKIFVIMLMSEQVFEMERISSVGMNSFRLYFGDVQFECTDIKYHKQSGRVSEITFKSME